MRIASLTALLCLCLPLSAQNHGIFLPGSEWETVSEGHQFAEGMVIDSENNLYFTDVPRAQLFRVDAKTGEKKLLDGSTGRAKSTLRASA